MRLWECPGPRTKTGAVHEPIVPVGDDVNRGQSQPNRGLVIVKAPHRSCHLADLAQMDGFLHINGV